MDAVDGARQLGIDLCDQLGPVTAVVKGIGDHVIAQTTEHDCEGDRGRRIEAILIVEIDSVQSWDGGFQSLEIFIEDAVWAGALRLHQGGDVLPIPDVG